VSITVYVHHTKADGTDPQLITSASTTISSSTASTLALSLGSGALQTFTSADPRRLRVQISVTAVSGNGSFALAFDGTCGTNRCTNLATPTVTVPESAVALIPIGLLIPLLVSGWWRGPRARRGAGWDERRHSQGRRIFDAPLKWQAWLWQLLEPRFTRRRRG
jgi:hypothetical protein